jgi:hypothetical protein
MMILGLGRLVKGVKSDALMKPGGYGLLLGTLVVTGVCHKCFPRSEATRRRSAAVDRLLAHWRLLSSSLTLWERLESILRTVGSSEGDLRQSRPLGQD